MQTDPWIEGVCVMLTYKIITLHASSLKNHLIAGIKVQKNIKTTASLQHLKFKNIHEHTYMYSQAIKNELIILTLSSRFDSASKTKSLAMAGLGRD